MPFERGLQKGLDMAIPLAFKKFALDQEQRKFDALLQIKQDAIDRANESLEMEKQDAKIKLLTESAKGFAEAGDQAGLQNIHTQLMEMGHVGLPQVTGMSNEVLDIAQALRGEAGIPVSEGIPKKFYTPPAKMSDLEQFKAEKEFEYGLKGELEQIKQGGKEGRALKSWITPNNEIIHLPNNQMPPPGSVPYKTGIEFETTPEGGVSFTTTALPGKKQGLTPSIQTKTQQGVLDTSAGIQRLNEIGKSFDPKFLELGTKWDAFKTRWKDKLSIPITGVEREQLENFAYFRRDAIDNINRYIKEITGAQMSEREADRLRKAAPDPGEGFFDGDSPTEFQSKWKSSMKSLKLSQARYIYLLQNGISEESLKGMVKNDTLPSLQRIEQIIRKRNKELEAQVKKSNPTISSADMTQQVMQILRQEFGI